MLPRKRKAIKAIIIILIFFILPIVLKVVPKKIESEEEEQLKKIIHQAEIIARNENYAGTTYYISSNGKSKDGTDINDPMSLDVANTKTFYGGDKVLLKRGDIFFGTINFNVDADENNMFYIGSYGDEKLEKPIVTTSYYITNDDAWQKYENDIYVIDLSNRNNFYGFYTYYALLYDIGFFRDEDNNIYGNKKTALDELKNEFDFYCEGKYLYVKSFENPSKKLGKITLSNNNTIVSICSNTIIDGIIVKDGGAHGIVKKTDIKNVYINNCIIMNIGGSYQNGTTRYGNGIEFWNQAENTIVQNCIFKDIYDAAYTLQGSSSTDGFCNNVCLNNIFIRCTYPFEFFTHNQYSTNNCTFEGTTIKNNIIINQGNGWGYDTRPDKNQPSNVVVWRIPENKGPKNAFVNNKCYNSRSLYYKSSETMQEVYKNSLEVDYNTFYLNSGTIFFIDTTTHKNIDILNEYGLDLNSIFNYLSDTEIEEISNPDILNSTNYDEIKAYYDKFDVKYRNSHATENIIPTIESIINEDKYNSILQNNEISLAYEELKKAVNNLSQNIDIINVDSVSYSYECLYNFINTIKDKCLNTEINMQKNNLIALVSQLDSVSNEYKDIYSYYITEDNTSLDTIKITLNNTIDKYNNNLDLDIGYLENIITTAKNLYNNSITTDNVSLNVLNKQRIINITNFANSIIDLKINEFVELEKQKIKVEFDKDTTTPTNENITATLIVGDNTIIKNNGGSNKHIFEKNETFTYELEIKGVIFNVQVTISNINKDYTIEEGYITNIGGNTQILDLKDNLGISNFTIKRDDELVNINEDIVKTGDIITFNNKSYTLIVSGDINSDGGCTIKDIVSYRKYLLKYSEYSNIQFKAADINQDNELTIKDLVGIRELLLN